MSSDNHLEIAEYWSVCKESKECKVVACALCPHFCKIPENHTGKCGVRTNIKGRLIASSYGLMSSIALDPIEKKPLYEFHNGKKIVSIGSVGCNLHCPFCQNYKISMEYENLKLERITPEKLVEIAKLAVPEGNIGVAYTYNEPLINYEFVRDCSKLVKNEGLVNVLVTNGYINEEPLRDLLPSIDAMNIDIKGWTDGTYDKVGGAVERVKSSIALAHDYCHVEVTTLVLPGENENDIKDIAKWLASIDKKIPYHLSRFFPKYKYKDRFPTPVETMLKLKSIAEQYLEKVYLGNM